MDVSAYIESGILEQFVLGHTTPEETAFILQLSITDPQIRLEIEAIETGLLKYAETFAQQPADSVKDKLFASLDMKELSSEKTPIPKSISNSNHIPIKSRTVPFYNYFIAASIVLFGISVLGNIWLYTHWKNAKNQIATLSTQNTFLTDNNKSQEAKYSALEKKVSILQNPQIQLVKLAGLPLLPKALATVYWNNSEKEVYLIAANLPANSLNEQYQLWAIVDGKPVDAGVFDTYEAQKGLVKMKNIANATAFAVTIEKKGGAINPTLEKMILMGAVI